MRVEINEVKLENSFVCYIDVGHSLGFRTCVKSGFVIKKLPNLTFPLVKCLYQRVRKSDFNNLLFGTG